MSTDLIGTTDAAAILCVSPRTVKRRAQQGKLPYVVKAPGETGAYLFDPAAVEAHRDFPAEAS